MTASSVVPLRQPSDFSPDALTEVIQAGARELLRTAVQAEVSAFISEHGHLVDGEGRRRLVHHGFLPRREVMTGIGKVQVQVPRVRDRGADRDGRIRFRSSIVPPYLRKAKSVEELLPWLYLKGISPGDFGAETATGNGPGQLHTSRRPACAVKCRRIPGQVPSDLQPVGCLPGTSEFRLPATNPKAGHPCKGQFRPKGSGRIGSIQETADLAEIRRITEDLRRSNRELEFDLEGACLAELHRQRLPDASVHLEERDCRLVGCRWPQSGRREADPALRDGPWCAAGRSSSGLG